MTNLNDRQLAARLGCSVDHVNVMVRLGQVPFFRVGSRLVRFRLCDIEACEANGGTMRKSGL